MATTATSWLRTRSARRRPRAGVLIVPAIGVEQTYAPVEAGGQRTGHFGFFRRRFDALLWPQAGQWLERQAGFQH